jgi:hypothetical protein
MAMNLIGDNENTPTAKTDEYYEDLAGQEELYLERIEENVRAIAICELDASRATENLDELRASAADNLVEGDSDDPPLGEEAIEGMRRDL